MRTHLPLIRAPLGWALVCLALTPLWSATALGDAKEQHEHAKMMQAHPDMVHEEEPDAVTVEPGQTKTLIWRFGAPGLVEGACHIPGHYEAGMVTRIRVTE